MKNKTKKIIKKIHTKNTKKHFLFNPKNPKKSFDVYIDKNPKDTIKIKYTTLKDVENTIDKLEKLYKNKKYTHKRIWQVGMIMYVRLKVLKNKKIPIHSEVPLTYEDMTYNEIKNIYDIIIKINKYKVTPKTAKLRQNSNIYRQNPARKYR